MRKQKPNHWIVDAISDEEYNKVFEIADTRLVYSSLDNCFIFENSNNSFFEEENKQLTKVIDILELAAIEIKSEITNNSAHNENDFYIICQDIFILLRTMLIPENNIEKIKFIYKIITFSYLGQNWESGRRFIIENEKDILVEVKDNEDWNIRLFKKTYLAFVHLIRKNDWNDLREAIKYITDLRNEQEKYEKTYLEGLENELLKGSSYELFGLYHLARVIDLAAEFMSTGKPIDVREQIGFHFEKAIEASDISSNVEMNLILKMLELTIEQMISNSIWLVTQKVNSRVTKFVSNITSSDKPVYELLYPQKLAILKRGLLDPAHKAVVVDMPTSSGKTLLAEFRALQALNQFSDDNGWVVYVAPTRALVNQICTRLRRDLNPIGIKVEKMSGAIEIDAFEENLLINKQSMFDVLVTTPEKLNLLIRDEIECKMDRPLALVVIDEAHNIEVEKRGISLELLMANIKNDCQRANFLLLTPFIPNSKQVAEWLDPDSPNSISIEIPWKPNDRIIGAIYPEGNRREWKTKFETLLTSNERIQIEKRILIDNATPIDETRSRLNKTKVTLAVTKQLIKRKGILAICKTPGLCWKLANELSDILEDEPYNEDIELVKKYISAELGDNFLLKKLLDKGIGVHHSGLPDEVKYLMEWLMEKQKLKILVATTTIAQGINFPVSTILMASYSYPYKSHMPIRDFWNLVGRAGRTEQGTLGVVGIAVGAQDRDKEDELNKLKQFLHKSAEDLVSYMVKMIEDAIQIGKEFDLSSKFWDPEWSQLLQYITHMYNQCRELSEFNNKAELFLRRTFGYNYINPQKRQILLDAVKNYGLKLNKNKNIAKLSDATGFSMEAINRTMNKIKDLGLNYNTWKGTKLFSKQSSLKDIMGVMLTVPEIKSNLENIIGGNNTTSGETLANITSDWVTGKDIEYISENYFSGTDQDAITKCCRAIYSDLVNSATWGLSSLQKIPNSGLNFDKMTENDKKKIQNLPAMIYYGVGTDEAILMRINNVPRGIAPTIGDVYKNEVGNIYDSDNSEVYRWLNELPDDKWNNVVKNNRVISGSEYKKVWKILNGDEY